MIIRSKLYLHVLPLALAAAALPGQPALAQAAQAAVTAGAKVNDTKGGEVGTITKVDGNFAILKTDKHEVRLPLSSFTAHNGALLVAMSRDEVNAAVEKTLAEGNQKIAVGATVTGSQGGTVGSIVSIDEQFATVKLGSGAQVRLPRRSLAPGPNGAIIGMTVEELEAAAAAAAGGQKPK